MSYQVNYKLSLYSFDKANPLTKDEIDILSSEQSKLHDEVIKLLYFRHPEMRDRMQISMSHSEVVFLKD